MADSHWLTFVGQSF